MIIADKPYISDLLLNTAAKNNFAMLETGALKDLNSGENLNIITKEEFIEHIKQSARPMIYCNSENSIDFIAKNLDFTDLPEKINLFKDKIKFRKLISSIYPDFYFKEVGFNELNPLSAKEVKFPAVLKPSVGFLSFGVYTVNDEEELKTAINSLNSDINNIKNIFPETVVDTSEFIIEELIKGEEFAVDVYFNDKSEPVILNIFKHPFVNEKDVSDRLYYTSAEIIREYNNKFTELFAQIAQKAELKNFPAHIELRVTKNNIIPIEVNPMRFAGWCLTDLACRAWGINVYEYCLNGLKPDWNKILKDKDGIYYYFVVAPIPGNINKDGIKSIAYDSFSALMKNPLEIRKIDYKTLPLFATAFAKTIDYEEINRILNADFEKFIET